MSRQQTPQRPPLLRLAVALSPGERRSWLEDMADEYLHVAPSDRAGWLWGAVTLALRWRVSTWRTLPRSHLAVATLALALLLGSPWILRQYLSQLQTPTVEIAAEGAARSRSSDELDRTDGAFADVQRDEDASSLSLGEEVATTTPAEGTDEDRAADPAPAAGALQTSPQTTADASAASAADAEAAQGGGRVEQERAAAPATVSVSGATLSLTAVRATQLEIWAGLSDEGTALLAREVAAGERFLLPLPLLVIAADGGALEAGALGVLGDDGVSLRVGFVSSDPQGEEPPP